jgi:hypothetical protein
MTWDEWIDVVKLMRANWPHAELPEISIRKWHGDLEDLPADQVLAGMETLYRDGRQFPPTGGEIRSRVLELADQNAADWSAGYALAAELRPDLSWLTYPDKTMAWLVAQDPIAAETVRRYGVEAWGMRPAADEPIHRAQFRQLYEASADVVSRRRRYAGIGAAGLPQLEPSDQPRRIGVAIAAMIEGARP